MFDHYAYGTTTKRWVIYEYPISYEGMTDEQEVCWHKSAEKAKEVADANHARTGLAYREALCYGTGIGRGWECVEAESAVYGVCATQNCWLCEEPDHHPDGDGCWLCEEPDSDTVRNDSANEDAQEEAYWESFNVD